MGICRIYYLPDGSVIKKTPFFKKNMGYTAQTAFLDAETLKRPADVLDENGKVITFGLVGLPYDDIDDAALPPKADRAKWRGSKGAGVRVDNSVKTIAEKRQKIEDSLDAELAKPAGNPMAVMKLQRQLDKRNF